MLLFMLTHRFTLKLLFKYLLIAYFFHIYLQTNMLGCAVLEHYLL